MNKNKHQNESQMTVNIYMMELLLLDRQDHCNVGLMVLLIWNKYEVFDSNKIWDMAKRLVF